MAHIEFRIEDKDKVVVVVETGIPSGQNHCIKSTIWPCDYEFEAILLRDHLNKHLQEKIQKIKKEMYEQGWKDAKAKRAKKQCFSTFF